MSKKTAVRRKFDSVPTRMVRPSDDGHAFLPDPRDGVPMRTRDSLAETLAEDFIASATSAEETAEDTRNAFTLEEVGGPFVEASAAQEFDQSPDESNPEDAEVEPFPTAHKTIE